MMSLPVWLPGPMFLRGVSVPSGPMFLPGEWVSVQGGWSLCLVPCSLGKGFLSRGLCSSLSRGFSIQRGLSPGGLCPEGVSVRETPPRTVKRGGAHPTEMLSC